MGEDQKKADYTPEQIKEMKDNMMKHWESEIPFLQKQKEYETLVTELEELRLRQVYAMRKTADIIAPPPTDTPESKDNMQVAKERKLKPTL